MVGVTRVQAQGPSAGHTIIRQILSSSSKWRIGCYRNQKYVPGYILADNPAMIRTWTGLASEGLFPVLPGHPDTLWRAFCLTRLLQSPNRQITQRQGEGQSPLGCQVLQFLSLSSERSLAMSTSHLCPDRSLPLLTLITLQGQKAAANAGNPSSVISTNAISNSGCRTKPFIYKMFLLSRRHLAMGDSILFIPCRFLGLSDSQCLELQGWVKE